MFYLLDVYELLDRKGKLERWGKGIMREWVSES